MKHKFEINLVEIDAWQDGNSGSIGWTCDILTITLPEPAKYCLVSLIWRGGWNPKTLIIGLLAGQIHVSTNRDFKLGPIDYAPDQGLRFDAWKNGLWGE